MDKKTPKIKEVLSYLFYYLRMTGFSLLAWILADALSLPLRPFIGGEDSDRYILTSGSYVVFIIVGTFFCFYSILFIWTRRKWNKDNSQVRMEFEQKTSVFKEIKDNQIIFDWKTHYKESVHEVLKHEVWKYGVWCIYPAITCAYTWGMGYAPQTYLALELSNSTLVEIGITAFKSQCIFFEMFYLLKIFSVPFGLMVGAAVFVLVYALILTLVKEEVYCGFKTNRLHKIQSLAKIILVVAVVVIVMLLGGWFR